MKPQRKDTWVVLEVLTGFQMETKNNHYLNEWVNNFKTLEFYFQPEKTIVVSLAKIQERVLWLW